MKKIAVIGSTGSIGRQALSVAARYPERFCVVAMAANSNQSLFAEQVASVRPAFAALRAAGDLISVPADVRFARGETAFEEACAFPDADIVLVAVSGFAGLKATLLAIGAGKDVALANKESLVVGGELVLRRAQQLFKRSHRKTGQPFSLQLHERLIHVCLYRCLYSKWYAMGG